MQTQNYQFSPRWRVKRREWISSRGKSRSSLGPGGSQEAHTRWAKEMRLGLTNWCESAFARSLARLAFRFAAAQLPKPQPRVRQQPNWKPFNGVVFVFLVAGGGWISINGQVELAGSISVARGVFDCTPLTEREISSGALIRCLLTPLVLSHAN